MDVPIRECQWIGPDQDPKLHWPIKMCGCAVVPGKSYCEDHYRKMYISGTAITGKRKQKALEAAAKEKELEALSKEQESDMEEDYV